jgi:hypothetical protein
MRKGEKLEDLRLRSDDAWIKRRRWDALLKEVHTYVAPSLSLDPTPPPLHDATAVHAAERFGARLHNDIMPPGQQWFELAAGPLVLDADEVSRRNAGLQKVGKMVTAVLNGTNTDSATAELCYSLGQGTACMLALDTPDNRLIGWATVPIQEIALADGPFGDVEGIYWKRKWRAGDIGRLFQVEELPKALAAMAADKIQSRQLVEVRQDTEYDAAAKLWRFTAYTMLDPEEPILTRTYRVNRWVTPRFMKVPGEAMGRGPFMFGLANAKYLNTVLELVFKSAQLALYGVFLYRDDSVFNPRTAKAVPGALWKVGNVGSGVFGRPIEPLEVGRNFDISSIVLSDQREQVRTALYDEILPDMKGSVRSPTEITERLKRAYRDHAGATGRLVRELVTPVVSIVLDVLSERGMLPMQIDIDQLGTKLQLTSPLARAQAVESVQKIAEGWQIGMQIAPEEMALTANKQRILREILRNLGWAEDNFNTPEERDQAIQAASTMMAAQMASEMAAAAPPEKPPLRAVA